MSLKDCMNHFMKKPPIEQSGDENEAPNNVFKDILGRTDLSAEEKLELLKEGLSTEQKKVIEEMLASGLSIENVLKKMAKDADEECRRNSILSIGCIIKSKHEDTFFTYDFK